MHVRKQIQRLRFLDARQQSEVVIWYHINECWIDNIIKTRVYRTDYRVQTVEHPTTINWENAGCYWIRQTIMYQMYKFNIGNRRWKVRRSISDWSSRNIFLDIFAVRTAGDHFFINLWSFISKQKYVDKQWGECRVIFLWEKSAKKKKSTKIAQSFILFRRHIQKHSAYMKTIIYESISFIPSMLTLATVSAYIWIEMCGDPMNRRKHFHIGAWVNASTLKWKFRVFLCVCRFSGREENSTAVSRRDQSSVLHLCSKMSRRHVWMSLRWFTSSRHCITLSFDDEKRRKLLHENIQIGE